VVLSSGACIGRPPAVG